MVLQTLIKIIFQSTLLQEERQSMWEQNQPIALISIHAPTRGATGYKCIISLKHKISIHAPTRGATTGTLTIGWGHTDFNPRSYKRSDRYKRPSNN